MKIIITGGLGYIGSNIVAKLLKKGEDIIVIDNLSNSSKSIINKINKISGKKFKFYQVDCKNSEDINKIFENHPPDIVIHLAGLKSVNDSIKYPKKYMYENLASAKTIISAMNKIKANKLIFSSSATVYGKPLHLPISEKHSTRPLHAYGKSKLAIERIINQVCKKNKKFAAISLRYFNPVGIDDSGLLFDNPLKPTNLFPNIMLSIKKKKKLNIWGSDYQTKDGTPIRDYIHILDLVDAHLKSIKFLLNTNGCHVFNVGTGKGYTVLEIIKKFESINKININYDFKNKRPGDLPILFSLTKKIKKKIKWQSKKSLSDMCKLK